MMSFAVAEARVTSTSFPRRREPKHCSHRVGSKNLGPGLRRGDGLACNGDVR